MLQFVLEADQAGRPGLGVLADPSVMDEADRVRLVDARYDGPWELPAVGAVEAPAAVLIRPDGYVGWVGDGTSAGLAEVLTTWFGPPTAAP